MTILHNQCVEIAGRESALLPARLYFTPNLDSASLARTLRQTSAIVRFQIPAQGRFDSALVPISWIGALVATARLGRWGWFVAIFLLNGLGELIYLIAGPSIQASQA